MNSKRNNYKEAMNTGEKQKTEEVLIPSPQYCRSSLQGRRKDNEWGKRSFHMVIKLYSLGFMVSL